MPGPGGAARNLSCVPRAATTRRRPQPKPLCEWVPWPWRATPRRGARMPRRLELARAMGRPARCGAAPAAARWRRRLDRRPRQPALGTEERSPPGSAGRGLLGPARMRHGARWRRPRRTGGRRRRRPARGRARRPGCGVWLCATDTRRRHGRAGRRDRSPAVRCGRHAPPRTPLPRAPRARGSAETGGGRGRAQVGAVTRSNLPNRSAARHHLGRRSAPSRPMARRMPAGPAVRNADVQGPCQDRDVEGPDVLGPGGGRGSHEGSQVRR